MNKIWLWCVYLETWEAFLMSEGPRKEKTWARMSEFILVRWLV